MKELTKGEYFGRHKNFSDYNGLIITDTEYTHDKVDWHYHENIYFTFLLSGKLFEGSKKESYECLPGSLLFHNRQEAHYNIKPPGFARGFHVEIEKNSPENFFDEEINIEGSFLIENPVIKSLMRKIFIESKFADEASKISIEQSLLNIFSILKNDSHVLEKSKPVWVEKIREILHEKLDDEPDYNLSLKNLSTHLNLHPVYLSRSFPVYFNCTIGDYLRKIKIEKSFNLLTYKNLSLSQISCASGFADQSHFTRHFKKAFGITPNQYRSLIF